jgi:hypothetical protein
MRAEGSPALVSGDMSVGSKQYTDIGLALMQMHESAKHSSSRAENFAYILDNGVGVRGQSKLTEVS